MSKYFWKLVALSFFDDVVPSETKQCMVAKLQGEDDEEEHIKGPQYQASFLNRNISNILLLQRQ